MDEANAIGTTYLRAETLAEPVRSQEMERALIEETKKDSHQEDEKP